MPRNGRLDGLEELAATEDPLWRRHEHESAAFEPQPLAGPARHGAGIALAWAAGLVALVAVAAFSAGTASPAGTPEAAARVPVTSPAVAAPATSRPSRPVAAFDVVESIASHADRGVVRRIEVDGRVLVRAQRVRITLEGREDRILRTIVRWTADPHGGIRPLETPRFSADFELPGWLAGGMWITVTAFDEHGNRLGRVRERIEVYPLT